MPLSIKDPEADRLARALAAKTGQSITEAVITALRARLEQVERQSSDIQLLTEEAMEIGRHCASLPVLEDRTDDEILGYNDELPKR